MKLLTAFCLIMASFAMCRKEDKKEDCNSGIPACVQSRVDEIRKEPKWNPPAEVNEYLYNGRKVYLFTANCCDQYITLMDRSCKYICAPSGGIVGKGDGKCTDFYDKAKYLRLVWKDNR